MAKDKKTKVTEEELDVVKGVAGIKSGAGLSARFGLTHFKQFIWPMLAGGAAAIFLTGKETEKKVKDAIKFVKEGSMNKSELVFDKIARKCKGKKLMVKKAKLVGLGNLASLGMGFLPMPSGSATAITNAVGKKLKMKKLINLPPKKLL